MDDKGRAGAPLPTRISHMRNLGLVTEAQFGDIGITTPEQVDELGAVAAYVLLKRAFPDRISLMALYALEAALLDVALNDLPLEHRRRLRGEAGEALAGD